MALIFLFLPVYAQEIEQTTAWDAGYVKVPIMPITIPRYNATTVGNGSCVALVKARIGEESQVWVNPRHVWNHTDLLSFEKINEPFPGAIVITSEGYVWHMAYILEVNEDSFVIEEQNYKGKFISIRELSKTNPKIVGYIELTK